MSQVNETFPPLLAELHKLEFDYADGEGIDFEPYTEFLSAEDTKSWIQAWTGNNSLEGHEYRVFGQDGSGGYAAFWCVRAEQAILEQPIVFFGSEGDLGIVASNFADYLWLLAGGIGPFEAVAYPVVEKPPNPTFTAFATQHAIAAKKPPSEVLLAASAEFPTFKEDVKLLIQY
jgi:hypothetical protein